MQYTKLSKELNVTRQELAAQRLKTQEVPPFSLVSSPLAYPLCMLAVANTCSLLQLESENSRVRRGMDDVLTELHKLFLNKTNGDTNALVEAEALRGELLTAQERADLAEQRTKIVRPHLCAGSCCDKCITLGHPRPALRSRWTDSEPKGASLSAACRLLA